MASIENLQRELNLPRGSGGSADLAEAGGEDGVGGQSHVDDVEEVEELGAELDVEEFAAAGAASDGGVFDQREIEVVVGGAAEGVSAERAEVARVGAGASGHG